MKEKQKEKIDIGSLALDALIATTLLSSIAGCGDRNAVESEKTPSETPIVNEELSNKAADAKKEIENIEDVVLKAAREGISKGQAVVVNEDGTINEEALNAFVKSTLDYELLDVIDPTHADKNNHLAFIFDYLDQDGEVTSVDVMNGALRYEDSLVEQSMNSLNENMDYSKIYSNESDVEIATEANDLLNAYNHAVAANDKQNDEKMLRDGISERQTFRDKLLVEIPDNPTMAHDFAWRLLLRMNDYISTSGESIITRCEERIFDHPIAGCMEALYNSLMAFDNAEVTEADKLEAFRKVAFEAYGIDAANMTKEQIIAAIQAKFGGSYDGVVSFSDITRAQLYEPILNQIILKDKIIQFTKAEEAYSYSAIINKISEALADLIEKGELNQLVFDHDFWVNYSKLGIYGPALRFEGNRVFTKSGAYITYQTKTSTSTKVEKVDKSQVPKSALVPDEYTPAPGRNGASDAEGHAGYDANKKEAAEAGGKGQDYTPPSNLPQQEKDQLIKDYEDAKKQHDEAAKQNETPKVEYEEKNNQKEEIVSDEIRGGEAINNEAPSSSQSTYNDSNNGSDIDLTLSEFEEDVALAEAILGEEYIELSQGRTK